MIDKRRALVWISGWLFTLAVSAALMLLVSWIWFDGVGALINEAGMAVGLLFAIPTLFYLISVPPGPFFARNVRAASPGEDSSLAHDDIKAAEAEVEERRRALGEEHPDTLESEENLARVLEKRGCHEEAAIQRLMVREARQRVLGDQHPDTLASRESLARALEKVGRFEVAVFERREVLSAHRQVLGEEHPDTLASRYHLALTLAAALRLEQAVVELRKVLDARRRVLGEEHPDTSASRDALRRLLMLQSHTE